MRRNRALWASIIFVLILVGASAIGFLGGGLRPTLGLDLQGGASVILTAPEGTPQDVMEQALENIRNRVDAFGVGEPDIALSGTTIEVQIPGSADASIRRREVDLSCLESEDMIHGCSEDRSDVEDVLASLEVQGQPSEVCVVDGDGEQVECFSSRAQADTFLSGIQVGPRPSPTPSASASPPSASPSASTSPSAGPSPAADAYCMTKPTGERIRCFDTRADADEAKDALEIEVTERSYCIVPAAPEPSPTPSPSRVPRIPVGLRIRVAVAVARDVRRPRPLRCGGAAVRSRLPGRGRRSAGRDRGRARGRAVLRRELRGRGARVLGPQGHGGGAPARIRSGAAAQRDRGDRAPRGASRARGRRGIGSPTGHVWHSRGAGSPSLLVRCAFGRRGRLPRAVAGRSRARQVRARPRRDQRRGLRQLDRRDRPTDGCMDRRVRSGRGGRGAVRYGHHRRGRSPGADEPDRDHRRPRRDLVAVRQRADHRRDRCDHRRVRGTGGEGSRHAAERRRAAGGADAAVGTDGEPDAR